MPGPGDGPAARTWRLHVEICRRSKSDGLDVGIYYAPSNDAECRAAGPHMLPEMRGTHTNPRLVCASHPATLARLCWERERGAA
jgi:hypothetical protein